MVSRENTVVIGFGSAALLVSYGGPWLTDLPSELLIGVILFVGVVTPQLGNDYLDRE